MQLLKLATSFLIASTAISRANANGDQISLLHEAIPGGQTTHHTIQSNGRTREYLLHFPVDYKDNQPAPLILSFHGNSHDAEYQESLSQFSNESFNQHSVAVYPQGFKVSIQTSKETKSPADRNLEFLGVSTVRCLRRGRFSFHIRSP